MGFEALGEHHATFAVDLQRLAGAVERQRKLLALFGIRRVTGNQRLDFCQKRVATGIERRSIERRIAIEPIEAIARQYRSERCRYRNASLGIETEHVVGHELVHLAPRAIRALCPNCAMCAATVAASAMGSNGLSWAIMVVNGR